LPDEAVIQTDQSQVTPEPQTEKRNPQLPEISALKQFREREASSANAQGQAREGQPAQEGAAEREGFIPRERFDQVNQRMQTAEQQSQQMQAMLQQFMMQQQQAQRAPTQHPGGMMNTAPAQQAPSGPSLPDFNDPQVAKEWQNKIANGGVKELVGLMRQVVEVTGQPLLQQFQQQIQNQLSPLQRSFIAQTGDNYSRERSTQDPSFQQVKPYFDRYLQEAVTRNPGIQLNPDTLSTIEHVARIQQRQDAAQFGGFNPYAMGQFGQQVQQYQQPAPFTERPGAAANLGQQRQTVSLTPQQRQAARGFGMTDEQYATRLRELGING
jgi:hypothetical protein